MQRSVVIKQVSALSQAVQQGQPGKSVSQLVCSECTAKPMATNMPDSETPAGDPCWMLGMTSNTTVSRPLHLCLMQA